MVDILKVCIVVFLSFSAGLVISSAVFAFIAAIGVVPSICSKTNTSKYIKLYEEMIIFGGIFGCISGIVDLNILIGESIFGKIFIILFFICVGVFVGILASSLAEVIDVIPIFSQRIKLKNGIAFILVAMAVGKFVGSIIFFLNDSFHAKGGL